VRSRAPSILFLAHRIPFPPDRGDKIRSWNVLKHLGTLGHVHLACFADDEADAAHLPALREAMGGSLGEAHVEVRRKGKFAAAAEALRTGKPLSLTLFDSPAMHGFVREMLGRGEVEAVYAFSGQMAQFVPEDARQRFVMDFVDMDSAKFADYAGKGAMRWVHKREAEKLLAFERATASRADVSLFVSEAEKQLFAGKASLPHADIRAVSNGIDLEFYDPKAEFPRLNGSYSPLVLFTGQMDYRPNVDAVTSFVEDCLPLALETHPDLCFAIVGRNPSPAVVRLADRPGVIVTGAVPDVRTWLAAADLVVAPLRIARGIQNKVLEAMAMGCPVIATPGAFEGIDAQPGRDLLVAATPEQQAAAIHDLLSDTAKAEAMGVAARERMDSRYRWKARLEPLTEILSQPQRRAAA
jgi:sugar transferase (PEP-CTERM/EpsH1 system associated)